MYSNLQKLTREKNVIVNRRKEYIDIIRNTANIPIQPLEQQQITVNTSTAALSANYSDFFRAKQIAQEFTPKDSLDSMAYKQILTKELEELRITSIWIRKDTKTSSWRVMLMFLSNGRPLIPMTQDNLFLEFIRFRPDKDDLKAMIWSVEVADNNDTKKIRRYSSSQTPPPNDNKWRQVNSSQKPDVFWNSTTMLYPRFVLWLPICLTCIHV